MNIARSTQKVFPNNFRGRFTNLKNRRDLVKRQALEEHEVERRAYIYLARNTSLPATVRYKAQLALNALDDKAPGPAHVKERCVETGKGRGGFGRSKWRGWVAMIWADI